MADRDNLARVDDEDLDAVTLFTYLKLTGHIPPSVFFTAELTFESNMVVLNRHIMQHRNEKEEDTKHNIHNKSFLTVKGRKSAFTDYAIIDPADEPQFLSASRGRQNSLMFSMKERVRKVSSANLLTGVFSLRTSGKEKDDNGLDNSTGRHQTTVTTKPGSPASSWSLTSSQKRNNQPSTVAVAEGSSHVTQPTPLSSINELPSQTGASRLQTNKSNSKSNSANSSARNTPRQHSVTNPMIRQASNLLNASLSRVPEAMSSLTPRVANLVEAQEIGPVVEVHELPVFASGRAFVPGTPIHIHIGPYIHTYIHTYIYT